MEYRKLGATGLKVSVLGFGNMVNYKPENSELDERLVHRCLEAGINFFDTAEWYADGECEKVLGKALKSSKVDRQDIVLSTKIWKIGSNVNFVANTNRKHVVESVNRSLQRLDTDYVDVVFAHCFDEKSPMEEICRGFNRAIEEGKAFYWGTSNWSAQHVFQAFQVCDKLDLHRPIADQMQYNMLVRDRMEVEYETLFNRYGYGVTAWSPLAGGYLTGKYLETIPEHTRLNEDIYFGKDYGVGNGKYVMRKAFYDPHNNPKTIASLRELQQLGKELGCTIGQLALAWVMYNKEVGTAITGARNLEQLNQSISALDLYKKWTPELDQRIGKILDNTPKPKMNFRTFTPGTPRRP